MCLLLQDLLQSSILPRQIRHDQEEVRIGWCSKRMFFVVFFLAEWIPAFFLTFTTGVDLKQNRTEGHHQKKRSLSLLYPGEPQKQTRWRLRGILKEFCILNIQDPHTKTAGSSNKQGPSASSVVEVPVGGHGGRQQVLFIAQLRGALNRCRTRKMGTHRSAQPVECKFSHSLSVPIFLCAPTRGSTHQRTSWCIRGRRSSCVCAVL